VSAFAILDSGIYAGHNGFKDGTTSRIVANVNFTSSTLTATTDTYGHGTHVAGLAAGSSTKELWGLPGIATKSNIISVKVLDNNWAGQTSGCLTD
jgi:subtilisin family serine protease